MLPSVEEPVPEPPRHASSRPWADEILLIKPWEVPATARAETIGLVEEEVEHLRNTIRSLHTHRNALVPFSRLPRELMTRIFWELMPDSFPGRRRFPHIGSKWIAFAQTCSLWRNVALESHFLWSDLYLTSGSRQEAKRFINMFGRCGAKCPISIQADMTRFYGHLVEVDDSGCIFQGALETALSNPSRLRALDLLAPRAQLASLASTITGNAPELKSLRLAMPRYESEDGGGDSAVFMDGLEAPGLRHLDLLGNVGSCVRLAGPNITHLLLTALRPKIPRADLFDILRRLPALTVLHLEDAVTTSPSDSDAERVRRGSVHLRMASQITLIESMGTCTEILRELRLPRICSIHAICETRSMNMALASDVADELVALLMVHLRRMCGTHPLESFELDSATGQWELVCTAVGGYELTVRIATYVSHELRRRISALVLTALQATSTRNLKCQCPQSPSDDVWLLLWSSFAKRPYATAPNKKIEAFVINVYSRSLEVTVKPRSQSGPTFKISLSGSPQTVSRRSMIYACLHGLQPFRDVKTVIIDSTVPISSALWERICELFNTAKELHLYGRSSLRLIKLLGRRNAPSRSRHFPDLESLVLHNTDMGSIRQATFKELKKTLVVRQNTRAIGSLELVHCHSLSSKSQSALEELVDTLVLTNMAKKDDPSLHLPYYQEDEEEDWSD